MYWVFWDANVNPAVKEKKEMLNNEEVGVSIYGARKHLNQWTESLGYLVRLCL